MDLGLASYGLSFAAGSLSILSPCVLPIVPIVLAAALSAHRFGTLALASGLTLSFTVLGVVVASAGTAIGLDSPTLRMGAAIFLLAFGLILASENLQARFALSTSGLSSAGQGLMAKVSPQGLSGQLLLGLLLGIVWSPCVGPTLGAAITLASQGRNLAQVSLVMLLFGLGASVPLIVLGLLSHRAVAQTRGKLLAAGKVGKQILGGLMLLLGALILTGTDKILETWLLDLTPDWLIRVTTSF